MARRHSLRGHAASVEGAVLTETVLTEIDGAQTESGAHSTSIDLAAAASAVTRVRVDTPPTLRVETVASNPLSGPITVPLRVPIGDTGIVAHPLALGASTFGWTLHPRR